MSTTVKCPFCGFVLEKVFTSHTEERYVCSTCGKQTTVVIASADPDEEVVVESEDSAA